MKKIIIICIVALCLSSCGPKKLSELQQNIIKKTLGDVDLTKGQIYFYDLNEDNKDEIIISHQISDLRETGRVLDFDCAVYIFYNSGILMKTLNFASVSGGCPSIYVRKISRKMQPVIFFMIADGLSGGSDGVNTFCYLTSDGKLDVDTANIVMPWNLILYQFDKNTPNYVEFFKDWRVKEARFTIHKLDSASKDFVIEDRDIEEFKKILSRKYPEHIWSGGVDFTGPINSHRRRPAKK